MTDTAPPATREAGSGRFVKGVSGNPAGRAPGTRTKIVQLQEELELAVREAMSFNDIKEVITEMVRLAKMGNVKAAKLILDKVISNATPSEESADNGRTVVFRIENATFGAVPIKPAVRDSIDVEAIDITPSQES